MLLSLGVGAAQAGPAREILEASGVRGGVVVHVGCGDGELTAQLRPNERYIVQGLDVDEENVAKARRRLRAAGVYGTVSVDRFDGRRLPYVDHFANLVVVTGESRVPRAEIMRVLAPNGVACVSDGSDWRTTVKPWPEEMDEWTHYMHDPAGTCVGKDALVGPPRRLRWVGSPRHARSHEHTASLHAMVSARGRLFYVMDEGSRASIQLPSEYVLTARDAFNGTVLWKRKLPDWFNHLFPLKAGPAYMPRKLVAVGEVVYVASGVGRPLLALDAATGKVLDEYDATQTTVDLIVSDGVIFAVVDPDRKRNDYKQESPHCWNESRRANEQWGWAGQTHRVRAILAESGKLLWEKEVPAAPMSIASNDKMLCLFNGASVVAFDREKGSQLWASENVGSEKPLIVTGFAPKLILYGEYVLYSPAKRIVALDGNTGATLWDVKGKPRSGHHSPEDLFVIDGIVWAAGTAAGRNSTFVGYDLETGEERKVYPNQVEAFYMHQRCYPGRATQKYLIPAATGTEFVDLNTGEWEIHHWARGSCIYGMMPANGMLYATPQSCACYYQSKVNGFNALAAGERSLPAKPANRLERGPAYSQVNSQPATAGKGDWPTFRHDNRRSGYVETDVPSEPQEAWKVELPGRICQPSVAQGRLFVAAVDEHTVYALDEDSGEEIWSYTTGGRVDSPPTIHQGMALFGSADGYVYAVRASDGELVWRFRAAPIDQRLTSYEQIESVWPLPGSVLIQDEPSTGQAVLYCLAGRNMFVDGGLRMLLLNPQTGELIAENVMDDKIPGTGDNLQTIMKGKHMPVAQPDILSSDGKYVYMKSQTFDSRGKRIRVEPQGTDVQEGEERHLFSPISFLDDSWFHRAYWLYGRAAGEGWAEWQLPPKRAPYGRIMAVDRQNAYAYGRDPELLCNSSVLEYRLYSAKKNAGPQREKRKTVGASVDWKKLAELPAEQLSALDYNWQREHPPVVVRAMVLAGDTLFVAGPPDVVDEKQMWGRSNDPMFQSKMKEQAEALKGKYGALLWAVSARDGKNLSEGKLDYLPAFDGMIAANGKLFVATADGGIVCYR
jgi:outer membrane protein assembly factor BamB